MSNGKINVASPLTDDEGIDLIFYKRGQSDKTIYAQVKSRYSSSKRVQKRQLRCQIRRSAFTPRENYYIFFIAFNREAQQIIKVWFVPSLILVEKLKNQKSKNYVFHSGFDSQDMWEQYRIDLKELPKKILEAL